MNKTKDEEVTRVDGSESHSTAPDTAASNETKGATAPLSSHGYVLPPDDDWRRFCVNHEGYSGPTSVCPACTRRRNGY